MITSGTVTGCSAASAGARSDPNLAMVEKAPMAVPRTAVGYSSAAYRKIRAKQAEAPNLPWKKIIFRGERN